MGLLEAEGLRLRDSVRRVLQDLNRRGTALLCLGQTVFWDEPLKTLLLAAGRELGLQARLHLAVHDTDFFSRRHGRGAADGFTLHPHDDYATRDLWAAAAETAALFGAEVPLRRARLREAGVALGLLESVHEADREDFYRQATAAWGWRGVVAGSGPELTACDVPAAQVAGALRELVSWGFAQTAPLVDGDPGRRHLARWESALLRSLECGLAQAPATGLTALYQDLLRRFVEMLVGPLPPSVSITASTELFRFTPATCARPRFEVLGLFLDPLSRPIAADCYDRAVERSGIYPLARHGSGALPFDVVIPGRGRATLRVEGTAVRLKRPEGRVELVSAEPVVSREQLAALLVESLGESVCVVGKAIVLPLMVGREWALLLHETASGYLPHTHRLYALLEAAGLRLALEPLLRLRLELWDALEAAPVRLRLPAHLQRFFGAEALSGPQFAAQWRSAVRRAQELVEAVRGARTPAQLLRVAARGGAPAGELQAQMEGARRQRRELGERIEALRARSKRCWRLIKQARRAGGGTPADPRAVERWSAQRAEVIAEILRVTQGEPYRAAQASYREALLRTEELRLRLLQEACHTIALRHANHRPAWWWLAAVDPSGGWLRRVAETAELREEPFGAGVLAGSETGDTAHAFCDDGRDGQSAAAG